jgi:signal transduction histidine kinase
MLIQFVTDHRDEIIARCRARVATRMAPRPTESELEHGIPLFLSELEQTLEAALSHRPEAATAAGQHGGELLRSGFTIAQVVHGYGDVSRAITELALERGAAIGTDELRALNQCIDNAIADAVTEYQRQHELDVIAEDIRRSNEQLGYLAHELRNLIGSALLAFEAVRTGSVGIRGSTGDVLGRSLIGLRDVIDRSLAGVRLSAGITKPERITVAQFVEDIEVSSILAAKAHRIELTVTDVDPKLAVEADRLILTSVVTNLLQNAFKYTRPFSHVRLEVHGTADRVLIDVADQCGGLPEGKAEHLFDHLDQRSDERTGLGLGLASCARGAAALHGAIRVVDHPGQGCVFTVDLPRAAG